jgi:adenosylcobinamide-GDP ribazoletransferase
VARGAILFPVVGAGVGVLGGLVAAGLEGPLPGLVAGALGVALAVALTGGLHIDALADTADALGTKRARALEIMRDPRIGAFGAAAVGLAVLVEAATLGALAAQGDAVRGFLVAGALSRATAPLLARLLPYAREAGTGGVLSLGVAVAAPIAGATLAAGVAVLCLGWVGLGVAAVATAIAAACGLASRAWLGGVTGDTLGATIQVTEVAALVVLLGLR